MTRKPIRVLHVIDHLGVGGTQVLLVNLCTGSDDPTRSVRHEVLSLHGEGVHREALLRAGVGTRSLAASKRNLPLMLLRLVAHLSRRDYDILHLHLQASSLLGSLLAPWLRSVPVVVTVYALKEQLSATEFSLFRLIEPFVTTYVSLWERNDDLLSIGVRRDKIAVIPIGLDLRGASADRHRQVREDLAATYGFDPDRPLLLSVARLSADRHIHLLVECLAEIVAKRPDALLLMIGDGPERSRLEGMVQQRGIEQNIIFGNVRTDLWNIYPGCDVYLTSSGNCDTGVAAMQAMACERPVVAYTIAPMAEPQKLCECQGVFIQARDPATMAQSLDELLADVAEARRLGKRARDAVVDGFSLDRMLQRYRTLYLQIVQAGRN